MDVEKMWMNSYVYNPKSSSMVRITKELQKYYQTLLSKT